MKADLHAALLVAVADEFKRGGITEMHLDSETSVIEGLCEVDGRVFVDPVPAILDTAIHEVLHRRFPRWGEKRVSDTAHALVTGMSGVERRKLFALYRRKAKTRKGVRNVDE